MDLDDLNHVYSKPRGLCGLTNIGNTCYMNSALQALSNCPQLASYFLSGNSYQPTDQQKPSVSKCYKELLLSMWSKKRPKYITPSNLMRAVRIHNPTFRGYAQQDTQEFLRCLMDRLHEELKQPVFQFDNQIENQNDDSNDDSDHLHSNSKLLGGNASSDDSPVDMDVDGQQYMTTMNKRTNSTSSQGETKHRKPKKQNHNKTEKNKETEKKKELNYRSIVTNVFDGKLLSSVQCLTCNRVSNTVETFQDLSLSVPSKEDLSRMHTQAVISCSTNVYNEIGWFGYLWDWMKSWFVGPDIQLQDCLAAFFTHDELKGDNMYNCEKCKKLRNGIKYSRVHGLPEVLCIHLKRFRHELYFSSKINTYISFPLHDLDMRPFLSKDCSKSKLSSKYDLNAVICHFGSVGGGHYIAYAKNCITRKWYEFNDSFVTEVSESTVINAEVYVLFYSVKDEDAESFRKDINHHFKSDPNPKDYKNISYISKEWLNRFDSLVHPGPVSNYDVLCEHGAINLSCHPQIKELLVPVPKLISDTLLKRFSGGPEIDSLEVCSKCQELEDRREIERETFCKLHERFQESDDRDNILTYKLSVEWYDKWHAFVVGKQKDPPGRIDNSNINEINQDEASLENSYDLISDETWRFLHTIYGGGPALMVQKLNIIDDDNDSVLADDEDMSDDDDL